MRLDLFLKITGIVKRRTKCYYLIKEGSILLNGAFSKPSKDVKIDDIIEISGRKIRVKGIPVFKNINKDNVYDYIENL